MTDFLAPVVFSDSQSIATRRRRRERAATVTGGAAVANKLTGVVVRLLTVPLALHALGPERYGLWMAVGSLLSWLTLFDFGIGNGLINPLSRAHAAGDRRSIAKLVSSALLVCAVSAAAILGVVELSIHRLDLPALLGVGYSSGLRPEVFRVARAAGWLSAAAFLLSFVGPFCFSAQRGYLSSVVGIAGMAASAAAIAAVAAFHSSTVAFVLATSLPPLAGTALLAAFLFLGPYASVRPSPAQFSGRSLSEVAGCGWPLLLMQIANLAAMQSANVLIAHRFGPASVPRYSVPYAMFTAGSALCYALVAPYWPAYTEALARGDFAWIAKSLRGTLRRTMGFMVPACLAAVFLGRGVIRLWAGPSAVPSQLLMAVMSVYFLLVVWSMNYTIVLLGIGALRTRAVLAVISALAHAGGFFLLCPYIGPASFPVGGCVGVAIEILAGRAVCRRRVNG